MGLDGGKSERYECLRKGAHDIEPRVIVATEEHETLARQKIDDNAECQPDIRESEPRENE